MEGSKSSLKDFHESPSGINNRIFGRLTDRFSPVRMGLPNPNTGIRWLRGILGFVGPRLHSPFTNEEVGGPQNSSWKWPDKNNVKIHPDTAPLTEELIPEEVTEWKGGEGVSTLALVSTGVVELLGTVKNDIGVDDSYLTSDASGQLLSHSDDTIVSVEMDTRSEDSPGLQAEELQEA